MNLKQLQNNFEALASEDPLWTVLSDNSKKGGKWDEDAFYATGGPVIDDLDQRLQRAGLQLGGESAFDFGCGVGRLTFPLSKRFATCYGVDIAQQMIDYANTQIERGPNCRFFVNTADRFQQIESDSIDFVYSAIVLQHIAPRYTFRYLAEFSRILRRDGLMAFQLPSHLNSEAPDNQTPLRLAKKRLYYRAKALKQMAARWTPFLKAESFFEMNAIRRNRIESFLQNRCSLEIIDVQDFPAAGPSWISYLYIARKRRLD